MSRPVGGVFKPLPRRFFRFGSPSKVSIIIYLPIDSWPLMLLFRLASIVLLAGVQLVAAAEDWTCLTSSHP